MSRSRMPSRAWQTPAIGRSLSSAGAHVALASRTGDNPGIEGALAQACDVRSPESLEAMVGVLESRPDAGVVYGKVVFIDEEDRVVKLQSFPDVTRDMLLHHKHSTFAQPSSLMRCRMPEMTARPLNRLLMPAISMTSKAWICGIPCTLKLPRTIARRLLRNWLSAHACNSGGLRGVRLCR